MLGDGQESAIFGLYVRVLSFSFDYHNPAPSSCQESKDSSSDFRARPRRLDEEPKRADALETFPIGILRQMYIGTEI